MRWFVLILFLLPSLSLVGLESIGDFLRYDVLTFLPRVIVAAFVLIVATIISDALSRTILAGAKTMSLSSSHMLATVSKYVIWVFAFIVALEQLGVDSAYMQILFTGIIAMFAIAGAIAFGLGGKDHASHLLSKIRDEMSQR
jgi:small-conductance mechanosensitive channel